MAKDVIALKTFSINNVEYKKGTELRVTDDLYERLEAEGSVKLAPEPVKKDATKS